MLDKYSIHKPQGRTKIAEKFGDPCSSRQSEVKSCSNIHGQPQRLETETSANSRKNITSPRGRDTGREKIV